jgi:hypothetical protein
MKVVITGSTGMVGKGVLLVCLEDPIITEILIINRSSLNMNHPKLKELLLADFSKIEQYQSQLNNYDACFFCMGISSVGISEEDYNAITYDLTTHFADKFIAANPNSTFIYVSGTGTDTTEKGRSMWARVKGKTENMLLAMPFKAAYMFRPGFIQPMRGIRSKTKLYQTFYNISTPLYPLLKRIFPKSLINTDQIGLAMINLVEKGSSKKWFYNKDINEVAANK